MLVLDRRTPLVYDDERASWRVPVRFLADPDGFVSLAYLAVDLFVAHLFTFLKL